MCLLLYRIQKSKKDEIEQIALITTKTKNLWMNQRKKQKEEALANKRETTKRIKKRKTWIKNKWLKRGICLSSSLTTTWAVAANQHHH